MCEKGLTSLGYALMTPLTMMWPATLGTSNPVCCTFRCRGHKKETDGDALGGKKERGGSGAAGTEV